MNSVYEGLRAERLNQLRNQHGSQVASVPFVICRRVGKIQNGEVSEHDRTDTCAAGCGAAVVYDFRHSAGIPHICIACAANMADRGQAGLAALRSERVTEADLDDESHLARMAASVAQARGGEHLRKTIGVPVCRQ